MMHEQHALPARLVTRGQHHFFGYYDKFPWNASGRYLLALEVPFMDRQPTENDPALIGLIDTHEGDRWQPLDHTFAWNWQQSTMLQWLPSEPEAHIHYNQLQGGEFITVIRNIHTGETRTLPRALYTPSRDGQWGISLNFARLHQTRPGYGYAGVPDPFQDELTPENDGVYWVDLNTGEVRLIISLAQIADIQPKESMRGAKHWFNHAQINTDSSRFAVLHRWRAPGEAHWRTRLITAQPDGSGICVTADHDYVSHYDWFSPTQVAAWSLQNDVGTHYFLYTACSGDYSIIGKDVFTEDGHCSFSPDRQWMLTDTYPDAEHKRTLILYHLASGRRVDIGRYYAPPELEGPLRCDLHPRWSRDGQQVCIDSAHEGSRQVYVIDVSPVVGA